MQKFSPCHGASCDSLHLSRTRVSQRTYWNQMTFFAILGSDYKENKQIKAAASLLDTGDLRTVDLYPPKSRCGKRIMAIKIGFRQMHARKQHSYEKVMGEKLE
ncbi:hypothetical protein AVEN_115485-1 [Araneus ventricosus]|uniref:Uncharacterized protein n=1 Tax=Araneus ventricosus TaxID=182803 RepID=A0A4Y2KSI9_ARAVE|nr:hypothetical protein AVEN_115485-1 [Araneus ventricosus]